MAGTNYYANISDKGIDRRKLSQGNAAEKGEANTSALRAAFPGSPIHSGELTENNRVNFFVDNVINGEVEGGNGINGTFFLDYHLGNSDEERAPDIANIKEDNSGRDLYSPYMPNPTSPGPGSFDATAKPENSTPAPSFEDRQDKQFGVGGFAFKSMFNPKSAAERIATQGIIRGLGASTAPEED